MKSRNFVKMMIDRARFAYAAARLSIERFFFDRPSGIETAEAVMLDDLGLGHEERRDYHATPWLQLRRIFRALPVGPDDVLLDLGCGKGRAMIEAAKRPFRGIVGLELSPDLAALARRNIAASLPGLACVRLEVHAGDAMTYEVPDEVTFAYLFDPFQGEIFAAALAQLQASQRRRPRTLTIIYVGPKEEGALLAAGARIVRTFSSLRPTRQWREQNRVRIYELPPPQG